MSSLKVLAIGGQNDIDRAEVRRSLELLISPLGTFEVRGLPSGRSRICTTLEQGIEAAWELSDGQGVYVTLNPLTEIRQAAKDKDVIGRRWLLIDVDAEKPTGENATDFEKQSAGDVICAILDYLEVEGWPRPLMVDSGNGWHLLYRIDLPNSPLARQAVKAVLKALAKRFNTPKAKVDLSVHNASRISRLPGTWNRKGPQSDARPHRMAKLMAVPSTLEVVTTEQLEAVGRNDPIPAPKKERNSLLVHADKGGLDRYVARVIDLECDRVAYALPGGAEGRNNALNRAAFALGTMADWPEMNGSVARSCLQASADRAGLPEQETLKTIKSGWEAGRSKPRDRPEPNSNNTSSHGATEATAEPAIGEPLTVRMDAVKEEKIDWLWPNRVAFGFIALFAGKTGSAKSFVTQDLSARASRGEAPPHGDKPSRPLKTLFISEDPLAAMLVPRLKEMDADETMIHFMKWEAMANFTLDNMKMMDRLHAETQFDILVIDPPANFLGRVDEHKNSEVRKMLQGLVAWITVHHVACIMITHFNKTVNGLDAVEKIMGSVAWGSVARITIGFCPDPKVGGQMLVGGTKSNLGEVAQSIAYKVVKTDTLAIIEWCGLSDTTMTEAMDAVGSKPKRAAVNAVEWVTKLFTEKREWESDEIKRLAKEAGVSDHSIFKSQEVKDLPIDKRQRYGERGNFWVWIAREGWPREKQAESAESAESGPLSPFVPTHMPDSECNAMREEINGMWGKPESGSPPLIAPWEDTHFPDL